MRYSTDHPFFYTGQQRDRRTPAINVSIHPPSKAETVKALKQLKNGKAAGPDGIPPEVLKINPITTAEMLHPFFLN